MSLATQIALGGYLLILAFITLKARSSKTSDFLNASKSINWRQFSLSLFASMFSSYNLIIGLTFAYMFGIWVVLVYFGAIVAFHLIKSFIIKQRNQGVNDSKFNSVVDYISSEYGSSNAKLVHVTMLLVLLIFLALQFFVNTSIFTEIIGWNKYVSTLVVGIIVLLYTAIAGLKVEIYSDIFQGFLMFLFLGLLFFVDYSAINMESIKPVLSNSTVVLGAVSLGISQLLTMLIQPESWQRFYAVKSEGDLQKGVWAASGLILILIVPIVIIGVAANTGGNIENAQNLFYEIISASSTELFMPFLSVALFAAFMSSIDSTLFAVSSQIGKFGVLGEKVDSLDTDDDLEKNRTIVTLFAVSILAMVLSLFFSDLLSYVIPMISLVTFLSTVLFVAFIIPLRKITVFISLLIGLVSFFVCLALGVITDSPETVLVPSGITILLLIAVKLVEKRLPSIN